MHGRSRRGAHHPRLPGADATSVKKNILAAVTPARDRTSLSWYCAR
jgi:hypothetical protein